MKSIELNQIDLSLLKNKPLRFFKVNFFIPLKKEDGNYFFAVSENINGKLAALELAKKEGLQPCFFHLEKEELLNLLNEAYQKATSASDVIGDIEALDFSSLEKELAAEKDLLEQSEDAPIIKLLNSLFLQAVREKASDIHIEPYEKELVVRMRIDGVLHRVLSPPKNIQDALISRIKIMADLDIAEKRLPQDGRIKILLAGREIDIRVSIIPTSFGERAVMRLLDRKEGILTLEDIGMEKELVGEIEEILAQPNGIILVTGPTGSGKTTTLYAFLSKIVNSTRNIITVEDPVEYQIEGVGQIQVNSKIGLTFASGLRSILRQDPDVIMVGEIRDYETAQIAIQASLTGHLVLSTLHTNDAPSGVTRLLDMEIEPFLLASSLKVILAQRLVRLICQNCKEKYLISEEEKVYFPLDYIPSYLYRGKGCDNCKQTGYSGRTALFEVLKISSPIRKMIVKRADSETIKEQARREGMITLREDGLRKVISGKTTLEEVLKVTLKDGSLSI